MRVSQYRRVVTNLTCYDVCVLPLLSSLINNLMAHPNSRCITISDSICATWTLSVLASDSTCGKWTQRRGGVNKKSKNVNYLKFPELHVHLYKYIFFLMKQRQDLRPTKVNQTIYLFFCEKGNFATVNMVSLAMNIADCILPA